MLALLIMPLVSADVIVDDPSTRDIPYNVFISNLEDYPNYVFVHGSRGLEGMCEFRMIEGDGRVPEMTYKFCSSEVYAIKKSSFNNGFLEEINKKNETEKDIYLASINAINVLSGPHSSYVSVPILSTKKSITNYYLIDLENLDPSPDKVITEKNNIFYAYILLPIIALVIIILILIKRKRK